VLAGRCTGAIVPDSLIVSFRLVTNTIGSINTVASGMVPTVQYLTFVVDPISQKGTS